MRLLLVHNVPIWHPHAGGGQRINHDVAAGLAARGHEVTVIHLDDGRGEPVPLPYDVVTVPGTDRPALGALRVARAASRFLAGPGAEVVYASSKEGGFLHRVLPTGVGLMATHHHPDPPPLPTLAWFRHPLRSARLLRRYQSALLEASLLRSAHHLTTTSDWSAEVTRARGYVAPDRPFAVVRNGLREDWFTTAPPTADVPEADLFFVGRLDAQKGLDVLLEALARPELEGRTLRVVGDGPDGAEYRRLADVLGLTDRVRFEGRADNDRVRAFVGRSAVAALPSRRENYPLAVLEMLAAGVPVVSTRVGGIPEMVEDGVQGLLVPPEDPVELAAALHRTLTDPELHRRLAAAGRERAEEHRWERILPRLEEELHLTAELARPKRLPATSTASGMVRGAAAMWARRRLGPPAPAPATGPERIAVVRFGFLGDHLLLDPLLAALTEGYPEAHVEVVVDDLGHVPPWMPRLPRVRYRPLPVRSARGWVRPGDAALGRALGELEAAWREAPPGLLLFADPVASATQAWLAAEVAGRAPGARRIGLGTEAPASLVHERVATAPELHEIERMALLAAAAGADAGLRTPRVPGPRRDGSGVMEAGGRRRVVLHPGASGGVRRWPADRFEALAEELAAAEDLTLVVVGTTAERDAADAPFRAPGTPIHDLRGRTTPDELAGLVAGAHLFVGNDSFPFHLAAAAGVPTVGLIGPGARRYYDYPLAHVRVLRVPLVCSPRRGEQCPYTVTCPHAACMQALRTPDVVAAAREALEAGALHST